MKNNYTSLKSPIDEEDELKTDHEIDLEKGLLPEYNSEEESTLPPYSDHARVSNPPNTHRENNPSRSTDNSSTSRLKKAFLSFIPIYVLNVLAICYLTYKDAFFKDYGAAEWTLFGMWCASCLMIAILLWLFFETWTKAVKVTAIGLFNIRREMMIIIWILWLIICCILFVYIKSGDLILNKALICSTCTISAVLFLIVSSVCIPIWTLCRALSGMLQVSGIHGIIALLVNGSMSLFGKHFERRGYEIEGFVLFFTGNALFLYEMERPGVLKRMRNTTGNVIGYICGGIGNAFEGIGNALIGANDNNNNIPLGEIDVEIEV
uniref:Wtf32 n=2 Tax=Schizosaccharomyces TaxID=4895 RepID=A0A482APN8_SCHKA|nr:cw11x [Schizosaccharomyces pombe]QBL54518.1 Wtf32 [Schizosaccharomyces kambucha]